MALKEGQCTNNTPEENSCQNHGSSTAREKVSAFNNSCSVIKPKDLEVVKHESPIFIKKQAIEQVLNLHDSSQQQNGVCNQRHTANNSSEKLKAQDGLEVDKNEKQTILASTSSSPQATARLLKLEDVPRHLQFNPYILTGYRHQMEAKECIASLSHFHNETINILTHGLPFVFGMLYMPFLLPWQEMKVPILPYAHAAGVVAPWFGSSIYHLFMNHHRGETLYRQLLKWDVIGVWVTQSFGALTTICAGLYHAPRFVTGAVLVLYMGLAFKAFTGTVFARGPWQRRMGFGLLFGIRTVIFLIRLTPYGGGHPEALIHVFLQDAWSAVGAVVSAVRVPERWAPGWFDYAFNSHNIMHVLVVLAAVHMHWAAEKDLMWLNERAGAEVQ